MNLIPVILLAFSMSSDAFAAALGKGAVLDRPKFREALRTGLIFGTIEATTPVIGWALGRAASRYIEAFDHWIAFALLAGIGGKMIWDSFQRDEDAQWPGESGVLQDQPDAEVRDEGEAGAHQAGASAGQGTTQGVGAHGILL